MSVAPDRESRLIEVFSKLPKAQQEELISIAELLRNAAAVAMPVADASPVGPESVIGALRRLRQAYPDVDRRSLMAEACDIVAEHALHGCAAEEAIARLERLFVRHRAARVVGNIRKR